MLALAIGVFTFMAPISASATSGSQAQSKNIVQTAVENGNFTTLATALTCTDLVGVLQSRWVKFTVFAPTDAAFAKLNLNSSNVCSSFSKGQLRNILLYHVNLGQKDAATVLSRQKLLMANLRLAAVNASVPSIDGAKIVATDIRTSNGIIHVLDDVMLP
jgi:uncharacterized surface protein with fasciclin (FAS1) repeats